MGAATLENSLVNCMKNSTIHLPYNPGINSTSRFLSNRNENICLCRDYMNVHSSVIGNSPKLGTIQMSIKWWIDKQNVDYLCNQIIFSNKKGVNYWNMLQCGWTQNIIISEKNQMNMDTDCMIHLNEMSRKQKWDITAHLSEWLCWSGCRKKGTLVAV